MCDSHQPLNGADSEYPPLLPCCGGMWNHRANCPETYEDLSDYVKDPTPMPAPVWPTRAMLEGWDTYPIPESARALVGAGARGGE